MAFDPTHHLMNLKGKDYLPVAWRLAWLRDKEPRATLTTSLQEHDTTQHWAVFKAEVTLPDGGSATGWGSESAADFGDYLEKAETKAIGRALAALGFGTQFAGPDFDEGERIVDSPQALRASRPEPVTPGDLPSVAESWCLAMDSAGTVRELNETVRQIPKGLPTVDAERIKGSYEANKARLA